MSDQRVLWLYGWDPLTVRHVFETFGGRKSCRNRDPTFWICHVTSHDHVIKGYMTWRMGVSSSSHYSVKLGGNKSCWSRSRCLHNLRIMWRYGWEHLMVICNLSQFNIHRSSEREDTLKKEKVWTENFAGINSRESNCKRNCRDFHLIHLIPTTFNFFEKIISFLSFFLKDKNASF